MLKNIDGKAHLQVLTPCGPLPMLESLGVMGFLTLVSLGVCCPVWWPVWWCVLGVLSLCLDVLVYLVLVTPVLAL